jgi:hypothetical protein
LKKIIVFTLVAALASLLIFIFIPQDSVRGIKFNGTLYANQTAWENFQYRRLISNVVDDDPGALAKLVDAPCGGGAGCYDHGAALVQILMKIGDKKFSEASRTLDNTAKAHLGFLMATGFEYGFPTSMDAERVKATYPLTVESISPRP